MMNHSNETTALQTSRTPRIIALLTTLLIGGICLPGGCPPNVTDPGPSVLLTVSSEQTGEVISFIGQTDSTGNWSEASAAVYQLPDGRRFSIFLGSDGQVSDIVANGIVFKFTNWTKDAVSITLCKGSSASSTVTIPIEDSGGKPRYSTMSSRGDSLRKLAKAASYIGCGMSLAQGTLLTAATGFAGAPVAIGMVALGCGGILLDALGVELPPGSFSGAKCTIYLATGQWGPATASCLSTAVSFLAEYEDGKAAVANTQQPSGGGGGGATDSDGDGVSDTQDGCPNDSNKTSPGNCGCGHLDTPGCGNSVTDAEPNNDTSSATYFSVPIGAPVSLRGSIHCFSDTDDYFSFDAMAGERFRVNAPTVLGGHLFITVSASGHGYFENAWGAGDDGWTNEFVVTSSARLYMRVTDAECDSGDTLNYTITIWRP